MQSTNETRRNLFPTDNLYLPSENVLYISMPKAGCSTARLHLQRMAGKDTNSPNHGNKNFWATREDLLKSPYTFTFVRDPVDRLISCYKEKIRQKDYNTKHFTNGISNGFSRYNLQPGMSFVDFVEFVCSVEDRDANPHFRSQVSILEASRDVLGQIPLHTFPINRMSEVLKDLGHQFFVESQYSMEPERMNETNSQMKALNTPPNPSEELIELILGRYPDDSKLLKHISKIPSSEN